MSPCGQCGQTHRSCTAHQKHTDPPLPCGANAIRGSNVCYHHGGAIPAVRQAAAVRVQEAATLEDALSILGTSGPMTSIAEVYEDLLTVASTAKEWRQLLVGRVKHLNRLGYEGITSEQVKADVQLLERAMDRSASIGERIARLNLEERKQVLDERMAESFATVIHRILNDLHLTEEQREMIPDVVPRRLRELAS